MPPCASSGRSRACPPPTTTPPSRSFPDAPTPLVASAGPRTPPDRVVLDRRLPAATGRAEIDEPPCEAGAEAMAGGARPARPRHGAMTAPLDRPRPHPLPGDVPRPRSATRSPAGRWRTASGGWRRCNIRDVATDRHRTVDDTPGRRRRGHGDARRHRRRGARRRERPAADWPVLYLSPRGTPLRPGPRPGAGGRARASRSSAAASRGSTSACSQARRVEEVSLGDFVMTGGEIAAMALIDATVRLIRASSGTPTRRWRNPSPPGSWSFRTIRARPNGKVCGYPRFSSRGTTDGSPTGDAPRRRG